MEVPPPFHPTIFFETLHQKLFFPHGAPPHLKMNSFHIYSRRWLHAGMHFNVRIIWHLKLFKITKGKKKIIGTCFTYSPIFHHFEFYDDLINWAKLRYYTLETYSSASVKDWKIWFFVYFQYKIWRNTILFWKTECSYVFLFYLYFP